MDKRALLSWPTLPSQYATDRNFLQIRYEPHRVFVEYSCLQRDDCRVPGWYDEHDCEKFVGRRSEAYAFQQAFLVAYGAVPTVRARNYSCPAGTINAQIAGNSEVDGFDVAPHATRSQQAFIVPVIELKLRQKNEL